MVGVLLVTHEGVGPALLASAERLLSGLPLPAAALEVPFDSAPMQMIADASAAMRKVDRGDGVLVLTDLYGASPSNLAAELSRLGTPVRRVSGASLAMLLRVMNYPELALDELPAVAAAGARNGVVIDEA